MSQSEPVPRVPGAPAAVGDPEVTAVVLAGGTARRFGSDKLAAPLHGTSVLDHLLGRLPASWPVVLVGPERDTVRPDARWTRERPPGGGPLAAVAAALSLVRTRLVAVAAGDQPYAAPTLEALVAALAGGGPHVDAAVAVASGRVNALLAVYRADAARAVLPAPAHGLPARTLLTVPHVEVEVSALAALDVDTSADLAHARTAAIPPGS